MQETIVNIAPDTKSPRSIYKYSCGLTLALTVLLMAGTVTLQGLSINYFNLSHAVVLLGKGPSNRKVLLELQKCIINYYSA